MTFVILMLFLYCKAVDSLSATMQTHQDFTILYVHETIVTHFHPWGQGNKSSQAMKQYDNSVCVR